MLYKRFIRQVRYPSSKAVSLIIYVHGLFLDSGVEAWSCCANECLSSPVWGEILSSSCLELTIFLLHRDRGVAPWRLVRLDVYLGLPHLSVVSYPFPRVVIKFLSNENISNRSVMQHNTAVIQSTTLRPARKQTILRNVLPETIAHHRHGGGCACKHLRRCLHQQPLLNHRPKAVRLL